MYNPISYIALSVYYCNGGDYFVGSNRMYIGFIWGDNLRQYYLIRCQ